MQYSINYYDILRKEGKNLRQLILFLIVINFISGIIVAQYRKTEKDHAFSNSLVLSVGGDLTISQTDYMNTVPGGGIKGSAEYFFPTSSVHSFGLKLYAGKDLLYGMDKNKIPDYFRTNLLMFGAGASYALETNDQIFPFASAGLSLLSFHTDGIGEKNKKYNSPDYNSLGLDAEAGVSIALSKSFLLNLSGGYHYVTVDLLDGIAVGKYNDFFVTGSIGISYVISFGGKYNKITPPEKQLEPKNTPPVAFNYPTKENKPNNYNNSANENTPLQIKITSLDSLKKHIKKVEKLSDIPGNYSSAKNIDTAYQNRTDLVYNENTTGGMSKNRVLTNEGTIKPETKHPIGKSAPSLNTKDKIHEKTLNPENKIPSKSALVKNETNSEEVVKPVKNEKAPKEILLHGELTFIRDEATIQPEAYSRLDEIAQTIKAHPGAKWKIEAYMDNHGSEQELKQFSQKRAVAILKYLTKKGISPKLLKAEGMGSKNPIEDNQNVWGRMMNRRVLIKRID